MNRPFYTEYVRHCLRFYCRNMEITCFRDEVDERNWIACRDALAEYSEDNRNILITLYSERDTLADNVYEVAKKRNINQAVIWDMLKALERDVAVRRGLL